MKTTITLILFAFAVIITWSKWAQNCGDDTPNSETIAQLFVAIVTTWAFYIIASDHIEIID